MFITLLLVTFLIALAVSAAVAGFFDPPIRRILARIIADEVSAAWATYLRFAVFVVGISSGVRVWELERYITPLHPDAPDPLALTTERWVLEVYRTIIGALQGLAWVLLVFFLFALVAYVIVRLGEARSPARHPHPEPARTDRDDGRNASSP
jgi:hypothetical protein